MKIQHYFLFPTAVTSKVCFKYDSTDIFIFNQASLPILLATAADSAADKGRKDLEEAAVGPILLRAVAFTLNIITQSYIMVIYVWHHSF